MEMCMGAAFAKWWSAPWLSPGASVWLTTTVGVLDAPQMQMGMPATPLPKVAPHGGVVVIGVIDRSRRNAVSEGM